MKLTWIDIIVYLLYLAFFGFAIVIAPRSPLYSISLFLSFVCAILWFIARWQLGDAFTVTAQARHLVTGGLYSKIRHPIYVFGTMAFLFVVLGIQGWPGLIIWAFVIAIQVMRVRREERVLAETFGAEYTAYRGTTWF
jgi:protein-S-isoprenylcysteine O-methyltransferase Ste14